MKFEAPTDYYDERIAETDEQIAQLINQRKELSDNNPGFPTKQYISKWAEKYDLYEDFLNTIFSQFLHEDYHKPIVEPKKFKKNIPILKGFERGDTYYSVTLVRQFENASVVHLNINKNITSERIDSNHPEHYFYDLSIQAEETEYECRMDGGGGSEGNETYTFVVSPALPDDHSKYKFDFKAQALPYKEDTAIGFIL